MSVNSVSSNETLLDALNTGESGADALADSGKGQIGDQVAVTGLAKALGTAKSQAAQLIAQISKVGQYLDIRA